MKEKQVKKGSVSSKKSSGKGNGISDTVSSSNDETQSNSNNNSRDILLVSAKAAAASKRKASSKAETVTIETATEKPEDVYTLAFNNINNINRFCIASDSNAKEQLDLLKKIYDVSSNLPMKNERSFGPFKHLLVDNIPDDSIWEQIQTRNKPIIRYIKKSSSKLYHKVK